MPSVSLKRRRSTDLDERYSRDKCPAQIEQRDRSNDIESNKSSRCNSYSFEICNVYRESRVSFTIYTRVFRNPITLHRHPIPLDWYRLGEIGKTTRSAGIVVCSTSHGAPVETPTRVVIRPFTAYLIFLRVLEMESLTRAFHLRFSITDISRWRKRKIFRRESEYTFDNVRCNFFPQFNRAFSHPTKFNLDIRLGTRLPSHGYRITRHFPLPGPAGNGRK